jgi:hypothetical protein
MELALTSTQVLPQSAPAARARTNPKNNKYANDGSYESVRNQLHKLALKCYARVSELGLSMTFDDVMGQMNLGYVQAKAKWNPEGGARFSTYCQTVVINNFNNSIEKAILERTTFGMVSYEDAVGSFEGDVAADPLEFMEQGADQELSIEDRAVAHEDMLERLASLSAGSKRLLTALVTAEKQAGHDRAPKLREIAILCGIKGDELRQVKLEILNKFGVRWV